MTYDQPLVDSFHRKIGEFHIRASRTERDLYEKFCNTDEAEIVKEMREYFTQAKQKSGVIFDFCERGTSERNNRKQNTVTLLRAERRRSQVPGCGRINRVVRRGAPVYAVFELELSGAERT